MAALDSKLVHVKVYVSGVLAARIQQVWDVVRNYGEAESWLSGAHGVKTFTRLLPGQINCQIGAVRLVTIGQTSFVDQLDALDDDRHVLKYKLISHPLNKNPFPGAFLNFKAVVRLYEVTRGGATFMEWTGEFDTDPQDCPLMRKAIYDRLEAGFQGLELLFPASRSPHHHAPIAKGHGVKLGMQDAAEITRGINSMNLRPSGSVPPPNFGAPPSRSPRTGPGSVASDVILPSRGITESGSGSSLATSPHNYDGSSTRPGSGSGGHGLHPWASGGMGGGMPTRISGEESRQAQKLRSFQEGRGSAQTSSAVPPTLLPQQVTQRQAEALPQREIALGALAMQGTASDQGVSLEIDPLLKEREEFKAALMAQRFQHLFPKTAAEGSQPLIPGPSTQSEPDWSRSQQDDPWDRSAGGSLGTPQFSSAGGPRIDNDAEWARVLQQREEEMRSNSPAVPKLSSPFTHAPFGANVHHQHPGGPFAHASGFGGVRRTLSHQSMSTLSHEPSGGLDRSADSVISQATDEQRHPPLRGLPKPPQDQRGPP